MAPHRFYVIRLLLAVLVAPAWVLTASDCAGAAEASAAEASEPVSAERVAELIEQLGDDDYFTRQRAQEELNRIGAEAFDALVAAEHDHPDLEVAARAAYLVRQIQIEWVDDDDSPEVQRLLEEYQTQDEASRLETIARLAAQSDGQGVRALCRLLRFEKSHELSRRAALALIEQPLDEKVDWPRRRATIVEALGSSPRQAANWVRTYLDDQEHPEKGVDAWAAYAETETRTLAQYPQWTEYDIVMDLWRQQATLLQRLKRHEQAAEAMIRMVALEREGNEALTELFQWLAKEQLWSKIDDVAGRFAERFQDDPLLLYTLAQARRAQGDEEAAEAAAARAIALNEGDQVQHLLVAFALQQRGLMEWSEREYRHAVESGSAGETYTLQAQFLLGELLHDQLREHDAAKVLEQANEAMESVANQGQRVDSRRDLRTNRARMHFFYSEHYRLQGDRAKQEEHLDQAMAADPFDVDALIGMYRLDGLDDDKLDRLLQRISSAATQFRDQIKEDPTDDGPYNQLAWLIANTEGDFREALRCSQKSLELRPEHPGHLDTLARCYYALGQYEQAVEAQRKAVKQEPHSGQMNRQLKLFEEALAAQQQQQQQSD